MLKKRIIPSLFIPIGFAAAGIAAWILLSNLGNIVCALPGMLSLEGEAADTLQGIGTQLASTKITLQWLIPAAIAVLFAALRFACPPKGGGTLALYIIAGILLWLAALAAAILFSRLGGIRILDIASSAAKLIGGGILENL
ncbi:MAG: hypothetical protein E7662_08780 [Ruminococcaceae bacterium]|nr:hypothetical protein [Oscillospiraceae bacterium]